MNRESLLANIYIAKALLVMLEHSAGTANEAQTSELFKDLRDHVQVMEAVIQQ